MAVLARVHDVVHIHDMATIVGQQLGTHESIVSWTLLSTKIGKVTLMRPIHGNL